MDAAGREMQVRTFVEEVWNGKNYAAVSDLYAANYANPFGTGAAARAEPIRRYHQAFPDLQFDIEELIVAGDTVVLRATFRGTDTGGYAGRAATGRAVNEWVVSIMHSQGWPVRRPARGSAPAGAGVTARKCTRPSRPRLEDGAFRAVRSPGRRALGQPGCGTTHPGPPNLPV
jgi:SnoaL-like polyketide cyclase